MILVDLFYDPRLEGQPERINGGEDCIYQQGSRFDISLVYYEDVADVTPFGRLCIAWMGIS